MRSVGIVRRVDELGRIVIPKETRSRLFIEKNDTLEIFVDNEKIFLRKYMPGCIFCHNVSNVTHFKGLIVCDECRADIKKAFSSNEA